MLVQDGNIGIYDSPYRNKYGETVNVKYDKEYDKFNIDQSGGGLDAMKQLRNGFINHQIANLIL